MDRAKPGSKMHVLSDANGLPLLVGVSAANVHDSEGLKPMVEGHQTQHDPFRGRYFKPQRLHADKVYDIPHLQRWLWGKHIVVRIARKGVESSERLGRRRWVIERTMSWLSGVPPPEPSLREKPSQLRGLSWLGRRTVLLQTPRPSHHIGHGLSVRDPVCVARRYPEGAPDQCDGLSWCTTCWRGCGPSPSTEVGHCAGSDSRTYRYRPGAGFRATRFRWPVEDDGAVQVDAASRARCAQVSCGRRLLVWAPRIAASNSGC